MSLADLYYEVKQLVKAQPSIAPLEVQQSLVGDFPEIENKGSLVWKAMVKCYRKHPDVVDESVIATIVDFLLYLFHRHYDEVTDEQMSAFVMHVLGGTVNPDFVEASVRDVLGNLVDQRLSMPDAASNNYDELATAGFLPHEPPVEMPLIPRPVVPVVPEWVAWLHGSHDVQRVGAPAGEAGVGAPAGAAHVHVGVKSATVNVRLDVRAGVTIFPGVGASGVEASGVEA